MSRVKALDKSHLVELITERLSKKGSRADLNDIDVSGVTNMNYLFYEMVFNGDISQWDTSNVTEMSFMFNGGTFTGDISRWDVSKVTNMSHMFKNSPFNGDISQWDTSEVTKMSSMFATAPSMEIFQSGMSETWRTCPRCS